MPSKMIQLVEPIYKKPVVVQDTEPDDKNVIWVDLGDNSDDDDVEVFPIVGATGQVLTKTDTGEAWADIPVDSALSSTSENPVQNKIVNSAISNLQNLVGSTAVSEQISSAIATIPKSVFVAGTSSPSDTNLLWIDTSVGGVMKYYDTESATWKGIVDVWG